MATRQPEYPSEELQWLALLRELQPILSGALNSLGGQRPPSSASSYLGRVALSVNRLADGYLLLREAGRVDASKHLIRPVIEVVFSGTAAVKDTEFLFRKAYSEWEEDKKLFARDAAGKKEADQYLEGLKKQFRQHCPAYPIKCTPLTVRETAAMAGLISTYEDAYRIYCKFTHSAMRAVSGGLDETTDPKDTHMMVWCVVMILDQLQKHTPAHIPDLTEFKKKLALLKGTIGSV